MKLLDELVAALSDERSSLADALMKTKVLLHRLGRKELAEWVNLELTGYPDGTPIPRYRVVNAMIKGVLTNGVYRYNDHPLPTLHLEDSIRKRFEELEMRQSISSLEALSQNDKNGLNRPIPLEFNSLLSKAITQGYYVERAWCSIGLGEVGQIVTQVRSRLLDFVLEVSEKVGQGMTDEEVKQLGQSPETTSMFNHAIFGDNVTILVGDNGTQSVANQITMASFESLSAYLKKQNVDEHSLEELRTAIEADDTCKAVKSKSFGPHVKAWLKHMLSKAVDSSWQIELGIASNLLTEALKGYYGW